jgi:formamidopyrimidine-DNA glycosylase
MPELPEVETIVRNLRQPLTGRTITGVQVDWDRIVARPPVAALKQMLPGLRIRAIRRRAKYLVFELGSPSSEQAMDYLLVHLKMSGRLDIVPREKPIDKHDHVIFDLDDGSQLRFNDARKFGRVYLVADPEEVTGRLGPEPLSDDFTVATFKQMLARRSGRLKPLLLDQTFIAGVGNIYADESLWLARLHPLRRADSLKDAEVRALYRGIRKALRDGLRGNGASIDWVYPAGDYQNSFRVYDREGKPCRRCKRPIHRIVVGQRGTHLCLHCQPKRG